MSRALRSMEDLELHRNNKLFINKSLCPYYKMLWSTSKKLHSLSKIHSFFISSDTIKIKVNGNSSPLLIIHVDDFSKHFPDVDHHFQAQVPFRAFSLKNDLYWLPDFNNVRARLFPHRQFSLYFLMNIKTTRLQQSIIFNLYCYI